MTPSVANRSARSPMLEFARASLPTLFASSDLDETRTHVGRVMKPHHLSVHGQGQGLSARMDHVPIGQVSINRLRYGACVAIEPGPLDDFYLVQMPLSGGARIHSGARWIESTPVLASVLSPTEATITHWSADNDQILVRVARPLVERALASRLGRPLERPIRFELGLDLARTPAWSSLVRYLFDCASLGDTVAGFPLIVAQVEQLAAATLLSVQPHDHRDDRPARCAVVLPRHVRRVEEYIRVHAGEPLDISRLAAVAGVSPRSLHSGFSRFLGSTPMHYLRDVRLDRARIDLIETSQPVGTIALRWGFAHPGRFSAEYRSRFGENPAETRRRR